MQPMQVTIVLNSRESELLRKEAMRELRRPKDQARILLRRALGLTTDHPQELSIETQSDAGRTRQDSLTSVAL